MRFRPCIDIHNGKVKQIVGGSLTDQGTGPAPILWRINRQTGLRADIRRTAFMEVMLFF